MKSLKEDCRILSVNIRDKAGANIRRNQILQPFSLYRPLGPCAYDPVSWHIIVRDCNTGFAIMVLRSIALRESSYLSTQLFHRIERFFCILLKEKDIPLRKKSREMKKTFVITAILLALIVSGFSLLFRHRRLAPPKAVTEILHIDVPESSLNLPITLDL
jgi:hypothetical protein